MMHVMSAPPSAPAPAAPTGQRSGRSDGGGEFARLLATQAGHATTEAEAGPGEASAAPHGEGEEADTDAVTGALPVAAATEQAVLPAVVASPAVTVDVVPPNEADSPADGQGSEAAAPSTGAVVPETADGGAVTATETLPAAAAEATSAPTGTSTQTSAPASTGEAPQGGSTGTAPAAPDVVPASAVAAVDGATATEPGVDDQIRPTSAAKDASGAEASRAPTGAVPAAPLATGEVAAATVAVPTEKADSAGRAASVADRPAARVAGAPQGQPDPGVVASTTSDVDGAAPTASRPAETSRPMPTPVLDRVMRAVEALENAPPPKRVSFEVDGLRLTVSLRGDEVSVAVRGGGDQLSSGWQRDLDGALRGRGLGLADGQGSDTDREGDGRRHPDQRAPHRSPRANPSFGRPAAPETSTSLQL